LLLNGASGNPLHDFKYIFGVTFFEQEWTV
jgi:hypothetical protein